MFYKIINQLVDIPVTNPKNHAVTPGKQSQLSTEVNEN